MEAIIEFLSTIIIFADELFDVNKLKKKTLGRYLLPVFVYFIVLVFFLTFLFLFLSILSLFFHTPSLVIGLEAHY